MFIGLSYWIIFVSFSEGFYTNINGEYSAENGDVISLRCSKPSPKIEYNIVGVHIEFMVDPDISSVFGKSETCEFPTKPPGVVISETIDANLTLSVHIIAVSSNELEIVDYSIVLNGENQSKTNRFGPPVYKIYTRKEKMELDYILLK